MCQGTAPLQVGSCGQSLNYIFLTTGVLFKKNENLYSDELYIHTERDFYFKLGRLYEHDVQKFPFRRSSIKKMIEHRRKRGGSDIILYRKMQFS